MLLLQFYIIDNFQINEIYEYNCKSLWWLTELVSEIQK